VNFDASTLTNGAPASLARRRAISVLPLPVGPMRMMLFAVISPRIASGAFCRRQRLRMAMATAFFASVCPMM
jgi:ammonia channel protein AmtB